MGLILKTCILKHRSIDTSTCKCPSSSSHTTSFNTEISRKKHSMATCTWRSDVACMGYHKPAYGNAWVDTATLRYNTHPDCGSTSCVLCGSICELTTSASNKSAMKISNTSFRQSVLKHMRLSKTGRVIYTAASSLIGTTLHDGWTLQCLSKRLKTSHDITIHHH